MSIRRIGIVHPGEMGISIAVALLGSGHTVRWASEGRSAATRARAEKFKLQDAETLANLCATCDLIVSICPPDAAESVAQQVLTHGYAGTYLDGNAIAPERVTRINEMMTAAGVRFVDGAVIGLPAWKRGTTWLYLSGAGAAEVAACFAETPFETRILNAEPGSASALKMCYSAYTKGSTALLAAILAAAEELGVREELYRQWDAENADETGFAGQVEKRVLNSTRKAWRFSGEMDEIAATFRAAGLPGEFHAAAAEVYRRLAPFKGRGELPPLGEVLEAVQKGRGAQESE